MSETTRIYGIARLSVLAVSALGLSCLAAWAQMKTPKRDGPAFAQAAPAAAQTNYLGGRRANRIGFVGRPDMQGVAVRVRIDRHHADAETPCRARDATGDLAPVGDQNFVEHQPRPR